MKNSYKFIFLIKHFVTGLFFPILSLFILDKGASLSSLAFIMGAYSLTAILLEFPSGIFCDLYGRKKTFLLSEFFMLFAYIGLFISNSNHTLVLAMILNGCARAFSSGSLDALVIEEAEVSQGSAGLAKVNGQLGILESIGIAFGSITSGMIADIGSPYHWNLYLAIAGHVLILVLSFVFVKESLAITNRENSSAHTFSAFGHQIKESIHSIMSSKGICLLTFLIFLTGIVLMTVQTYWQAYFKNLSGIDGKWLFGVIGCAGFFATAIGSYFCQWTMQHLTSHRQWWNFFFFTKAIFSVTLLIFALQQKWYFFILDYSVLYLTLGAASVAENTLLSRLVSNDQRASIMSFISLIFQLGSLCSSALCGVIIKHMTIPSLWISFGIVLLFFLLLSGIYYCKKIRL